MQLRNSVILMPSGV